MFGRRFESAHLHKIMKDDKKVYWFAIRVSYGRVLKVADSLREDGFECFVPMCRKKVDKDGKKIFVTVPAVSNLGFVHTTRSRLEEYFEGMGEDRPAHFMWDRSTRKPMIVSDKAMADFMHVCQIMSDEALYLKDITDKLRLGQKVRVIDGPFKGVEGTVLRIRRSRRVVVEIPGLLAVATTYIDPREIELM